MRKYLELPHGVPSHDTGCQTAIAMIIRKKQADYLLALKDNQGTLHEDVKLYFEDEDLQKKCAYHKTREKSRGGIELREYWQTDDIGWLSQKKDWAGIKSIAMTRNTITRNGKTTIETRYFISSLPLKIEEVAFAIRGHWMVESYHWHLDVTFREGNMFYCAIFDRMTESKRENTDLREATPRKLTRLILCNMSCWII